MVQEITCSSPISTKYSPLVKTECAWNGLGQGIHIDCLVETHTKLEERILTSKKTLKTHLFKIAYDSA